MASNILANAAFYESAPTIDPAERDRLILENLSHVRWVAMRIHEKLGGAVSLEDLVSSGVIGLINAVDSYDPKFNVKLKTYAEHRIRGAILDSGTWPGDGVETGARRSVQRALARHGADRPDDPAHDRPGACGGTGFRARR